MAAAAHIQVPFWPVKLSMQSAIPVIAGALFGRKIAVASMLLYLVKGASGFPVFQSGSGLGYMTGPTGGYLLGFIFQAYVAGWLAEQGMSTRFLSAFALVGLALLALYIPGLLWLTVLFGPESSLEYGFFPFIPGEVLKGLMVWLLIRAIPFRQETAK
jgi:biotin transport system substrate-specific component